MKNGVAWSMEQLRDLVITLGFKWEFTSLTVRTISQAT